MSKKRSLSALGAALLAGVTLATMVAPAANAAPAPTPRDAASTSAEAPQIQLISDRNLPEYTYLSSPASVATTYIKSEALRLATKISLVDRGEGILALTNEYGNCMGRVGGYNGIPANSFYGTSTCDSPEALFTQTANGSFKSLAGWYITDTPRAHTMPGFGFSYFAMSQDPKEAGHFIDIPGIGVELSAAGSFSSTNDERATIAGTAAANTPITIKDSAGKVVASGTSGADGAFSIPVPAPNRGGAYALDVTQTLDGTESAPVKVSLRYGKAVAISTPANNADHSGGAVAMTGTGTPGGTVTVFDNSGTASIGDATVNASGAWTLNTSALNAAEHKLEVKQLSKGNNTTTSTITLNPGGTVTPPAPGIAFEVTTPKNDSTIETSDKQVTFTGRGNPGSKVSIMNGARTIGSVASVPASGNWSFTATMNYADYNLTAYYKKVPTGAVTSQQPLHITVTDATAARPFVISTPANNSTVETTDKSVRFSGTGNAGGKVTIMNSSRNIGTADVDQDGQWSFTATMNYADYDLTAYYKKVPAGAVTSQQALKITVTPGQLGFAIGSPAAGTTVDKGNISFTGTGKAGSTVTIFLNSSKRGSAITAADGTWTVPVTVNTPGQYDFTVYYKANPTDASAPSVKHALTVR